MNAMVLACPIAPGCDGLGDARTIKEFFVNCMIKLWDEEDGFGGKRPYGNSGWSTDIALSLVVAGIVEGIIDEDGYLESVDNSHEAMVRSALNSLR